MKHLFFIFTSVIFSFPTSFHLSRDNQNIDNALISNGIINIEPLNESCIYFGTSAGLGTVNIDGEDRFFSMLVNESMPEGGSPALVIADSIIAVSGVTTFYSSITNSNEPKGTGIAYSIDYGSSWKYVEQPIVDNPEESSYYYFSWGGQMIQALAVTTAINNVSYDLAISGDYIYSTSWAGGLQRFNYTELSSEWEVIPLPMDNQSELRCGDIDIDSYVLNPKDPIDDGNHNHKGFSVFIEDGVIWVGTANGINKGIIEGECINWLHFTNDDGLSGNWVIGIESGLNNLWAISWATTSLESMGLSYFESNGSRWNSVEFFTKNEIKIYDLEISDDKIYASTNEGLYVSEDGIYWELIPDFVDSLTGEVILDDVVYATYATNESEKVWIGTGDGIAIREPSGFVDIIRFWESSNMIYESDFSFSAYPNPFYYREQNVFNNSGHVRFVYSLNSPATIDIYNFSMDHVIHLDNSHVAGSNGEFEIIWDGKNSRGDVVANGIYFCRLSANFKNSWVKLAVVSW